MNRISCRRVPRPLGALALAILEQLGKDLDRDPQLSQQDAWRLARVWLKAEPIQGLIVIGADQLDGDTWRDLADTCRQLPTPSVILIQHHPGGEPKRRKLLDSERYFTSVEPPAFHDGEQLATLHNYPHPVLFPQLPQV